ncbi:MAG: hypothetical protein NT038_07100 [Euryarchaeota archaeon]|nr:hypothetical protein [Euryarchaeota archaeon]
MLEKENMNRAGHTEQMEGKKNNRKEWTDASLHYYHKYTLKYLLELDVITCQKQPNDFMCTTEPSVHFVELLKTRDNGHNRMISFEKILEELTRNKGIKLKKSLLYDMIKLMGLDFAETSLSYYHKRTLDCLEDLGIVIHHEKSNGKVFSIEQTPYFITLLTDYNEKNTSKMVFLDRIIKTLSQKKGIRLSKKLRYDMIKLMGFIDKFGENGKIWATHE